jgi:hypothetical protein
MRLRGVDPGGLFQRVAYWFTRRMLGRVPEPMRIRARSRAVLKAYVNMERALQGATTVPATITGIAQIRVAMNVGCPF